MYNLLNYQKEQNLVKKWSLHCYTRCFHILFVFQVTDKWTLFAFIQEFIEESEDKEELSEGVEKNHVKPGEKPSSCSQTKRKHLKKKRTDKSVICTQCGMGFAYKYSLDAHMRVHTGERPYSCALCGASFTRRGSLNAHMRTPRGKPLHLQTMWEELLKQRRP